MLDFSTNQGAELTTLAPVEILVHVSHNTGHHDDEFDNIWNLQRAYHRLFRIFYHKGREDDLDLYEIQNIINLVDQYSCLATIALAAEGMLIAWSREYLIPSHPIDVLLLAVKIHSKLIYTDAFIHFVDISLDSDRPSAAYRS